jgi:hypothetical protein
VEFRGNIRRLIHGNIRSHDTLQKLVCGHGDVCQVKIAAQGEL